jgi:hypothetical protein
MLENAEVSPARKVHPAAYLAMVWEGEGPFWDKPQARQVSPPEGGREIRANA